MKEQEAATHAEQYAQQLHEAGVTREEMAEQIERRVGSKGMQAEIHRLTEEIAALGPVNLAACLQVCAAMPNAMVMEVVRGFHRIGAVHRADQFVGFLSEVEVLSFDTGSAILAGRIDAALTGRGRIIGVADVAIAACALQLGHPVCTGNLEHYEYIQEAGFPVVLHNWRQAQDV